MTPTLRLLSFIAFAFLGCLADAAPQPDPTFGSNGGVRTGVPTGYEDTAYASAIQSDGKVIVAGTSLGRQTYAFVTRFRTDGTPDPEFGTSGTVLTPPPPTYFWTTPIQVTPQADGSLFVVGILYNGFVLTRIAPGGVLDSTFGTGGMLVVTDNDAFKGRSSDGSIRLAVQPDGKVLVVTDASANGVFMLRFRRFLQNGVIDTSFGSGGERLLGNLPGDFVFMSANLAVAEPGGGFTLAALPTFSGGTYLLLRVTANGALDTSFGGVGYRSGFDLGNPFDTPSNLARTMNNGYALFGRQGARPAPIRVVMRSGRSTPTVRPSLPSAMAAGCWSPTTSTRRARSRRWLTAGWRRCNRAACPVCASLASTPMAARRNSATVAARQSP